MATPFSLVANIITNRTRCKTGRLFPLRISLACLIVTVPAFSQTIVESRQTYELVASATIEMLPAPLRSWFDNRGDLYAAVFTAKTDEIKLRIDDPSQQHFTWLKESYPNKLKKRRKVDYLSTLTIAQVDGQSPSLLEMIEQQYVSLVEAFRQGDTRLAISTCGTLVHHVLDASLPSHVALVEPDWTDPKAGKLHKQIERLAFHESQRLNEYGERFSYEIRVWPKRLREVNDISQTVLASLHRASSVGHDLYNNTELAASMTTGRHEHVAMLIRGQLEAAVLLSGSLINSAWQQAGSPFQQSKTTQIQESNTTDRDTASTFVGSEHSNIFHLSTCPHAKRIKPGNLVHFNNLDKAYLSERKACKTCKPDG